MYTVVEIGCGEFPTPRFDGADRHIALDIDAEAIDSALKFGDGHVIPVIGDASQIGLRDSCADIVVARNVFGDPALGMSERNNKMFQSLSLVMIQQGEFDKLHKTLVPFLNPNISFEDNHRFVQKQFRITQKHLDSVDSKSPLEDLLAEKAAVLIR